MDLKMTWILCRVHIYEKFLGNAVDTMFILHIVCKSSREVM